MKKFIISTLAALGGIVLVTFLHERYISNPS